MGSSARYPTANVEAFDQLPWTKSQADSLSAQWEAVTDVPQIPGNYYITRNVSFAFRAVVYKNENERESLYKYNKEINKEIDRKRKRIQSERLRRAINMKNAAAAARAGGTLRHW